MNGFRKIVICFADADAMSADADADNKGKNLLSLKYFLFCITKYQK